MTPEQQVHPGRILVRELKARGITQKQLAEMLSRPEKWVCEIVTGKKSIVAKAALDLELALGIPAENWMNLQSQFDLSLERKTYSKSLKEPSKPKNGENGRIGKGKIESKKEQVIELSKTHKPHEIAQMFGWSEPGVIAALKRWGHRE